MKKLLFWIVLIVGTVALLGSCAKKDETATAIPATGTGTTASGTITGSTRYPLGYSNIVSPIDFE